LKIEYLWSAFGGSIIFVFDFRYFYANMIRIHEYQIAINDGVVSD